MRKIFYAIVIITIPMMSISQTNEDKFYEIAEKIEGLLKYRDKSPVQLRELLGELEKYSEGNKNSFELLKNRCDAYILPIEIKLVRSDVFNKNFKNAVSKTRDLKTFYPYKDEINNLESYVDRKLYKSQKKEFLKPKSTIFSIEPMFGIYSQEIYTKDIETLTNFYPVYGLGLYGKVGIKSKYSYSSKPKFSYSQIGLKFEYRDTNYRVIPNDSMLRASPYINSQLSFLIRKTLGFDLGILSYSSNSFPNYYSFNTSVYLPMGYFSLGINTRIFTDFKSPTPLIQFGASLKFNIGAYRTFLWRDKEEVKSKVIQFKESI